MGISVSDICGQMGGLSMPVSGAICAEEVHIYGVYYALCKMATSICREMSVTTGNRII
jgi:hypothetical protein